MDFAKTNSEYGIKELYGTISGKFVTQPRGQKGKNNWPYWNGKAQQLQTVERKVWDEMGEANSKVLIEEMTLYNHLLKEMVDCETKDI